MIAQFGSTLEINDGIEVNADFGEEDAGGGILEFVALELEGFRICLDVDDFGELEVDDDE